MNKSRLLFGLILAPLSVGLLYISFLFLFSGYTKQNYDIINEIQLVLGFLGFAYILLILSVAFDFSIINRCRKLAHLPIAVIPLYLVPLFGVLIEILSATEPSEHLTKAFHNALGIIVISYLVTLTTGVPIILFLKKLKKLKLPLLSLIIFLVIVIVSFMLIKLNSQISVFEYPFVPMIILVLIAALVSIVVAGFFCVISGGCK